MICSLTLRALSAIFLCVLLHAGILAQMVQAKDSGPLPAGDECCSHEEIHPAHDENGSRGCPEDSNCPIEGDHCHHAGVCGVHGVIFFFPAGKSIVPVSPEARDFTFEILEDHPEDGPVRKLDKPPLI